MTEGVPPGSSQHLAVVATPGEDGYVRLRIYQLDPNDDTMGIMIQSVALYPESARRVALNLTKASIECEERGK